MSLFDTSYAARRIAAGGTEIHLRLRPNPGKPALLLLHGYPETHAMWHKLAPLLVLWGARGFVGRTYDVLALWREKARDVRGRGLDCGHFLPEELPAEVAGAMREFFGGIAVSPAPTF